MHIEGGREHACRTAFWGPLFSTLSWELISLRAHGDALRLAQLGGQQQPACDTAVVVDDASTSKDPVGGLLFPPAPSHQHGMRARC